ncbi:SCO family protein [Aestuariivirga litoralis]|uniref:SCO family protein n=1 Tax=Aestuariivirga litoralis TaxID=2650924 RepID=UPI0018C65DCE|nr:SCO family protein [Aestuariivirga litoralis]MBG1232263.1 SCO family protein [Aestuariivirga litoralis]
MMASQRSFRLALWGMVLLCVGILGLVAYGQFSGKSNTISSFGEPFKLASTAGGELDSATLKGKPYGLFFGFTHCPEVCPTTLFEMSTALKEVGDAGKDFRLFFITVDPERDTLPVVKDYLANFDPRIEGLVPTVAQLPGLARGFHIYYKQVPTSDGSYTMDHTATLFLMNGEGGLARTISFDEPKETKISKLKMLLAGK